MGDFFFCFHVKWPSVESGTLGFLVRSEQINDLAQHEYLFGKLDNLSSYKFTIYSTFL